jgi:hypothetical protein
MREAVRKIVDIMKPLTPAERVALIQSYGETMDDAKIKAMAVAFATAHLNDEKRNAS